VHQKCDFPARLWAVLDCSGALAPSLIPEASAICNYSSGETRIEIEFPENGFRIIRINGSPNSI